MYEIPSSVANLVKAEDIKPKFEKSLELLGKNLLVVLGISSGKIVL